MSVGHIDHSPRSPLTRQQRDCLAAAVVDDLVRLDGGWISTLPKPQAWSSQCVSSLQRRGFLEEVGLRDQFGRPRRMRASAYARREMARLTAKGNV